MEGMHMPGLLNFRDFGGLRSQWGGYVMRDRLYRSGSLTTVRNDDLERLLQLDFALIADLRYAGERADEPSPWPPGYAGRIFFHNGDGTAEAPHMAPLRHGLMDEALAQEIYLHFYRELPFDPLYRPLFTRILSALPDLHGRTLIHCSAGKDRTGTLVALIQHALGVPREEILADYIKWRETPGLGQYVQATAEKLQERLGAHVRVDLVAKLLDVEEAYLDEFFAEIERRCGSIDAYLDSCGLDATRRELLRSRLLTRGYNPSNSKAP
jgi:protein tyrosine/serine phosphatase